MNKKKLLLIVFFIGLPQVYGSDEPKDLSHRNPVRKEEIERPIEKSYMSDRNVSSDYHNDLFSQADQKKEGCLAIEQQRKVLEKEFFELGKNVDTLRLEETKVRESILNLEKFKIFLEKKENDKLTEEDLISKEGLVLREALFEYAFKASRFNKIQEEFLLKNKELMELQKDLIEKEENEEQLKEKIKALSGLQAPLAKAEAHYDSVLKCLALLDEENQNFDQNCEILKNYLLELGYSEENSDLQKVLQKNTGVNQQDKISLKGRIQLFNTLDSNETQIRTSLVFADFAQKLTKLLALKQFASVEAPNFHDISSDLGAVLKWEENTKKLIDFIIADWQLIKDKKINFNGSNDLNLLLGMGNEALGKIEVLIYPLKNMPLAEFSVCIDSFEKRNLLLNLLQDIAGYLDWLKTEFGKREKAVNNQLYGRDENIRFTKDYNKKASIKTMHDYLYKILVSSKKYTKAIDFIFQKIGRLTSQQCLNGANSYIEEVKPIREIGELLSVIGLLNMGLSLRGHTLNGMKQSILELKTYFKNKELKSAAKYVGASFNKKHLFGFILPVGIGVACYGHYKTDTLRQKRDRFKNVITELEKPYQKRVIQE